MLEVKANYLINSKFFEALGLLHDLILPEADKSYTISLAFGWLI